MNKRILLLVVAIGAVALLVGGYTVKKPDFSSFLQGKKVLNEEIAKEKAVKFISENMVQAGTKVDVAGIVRENDMYKLELNVGDQSAAVYMTLDGEKLFLDAIDMNEDVKKVAEAKGEETVEVSKSDKPVVELFVMSYCPYGTQIEKGILPVLDTLGDKIDFKLKFVDYIMHEKVEIDENLRQYCVEKTQPEKLNNYLACFLKEGEGTEKNCMESAGVDQSRVSSCVESADKEFKITEKYKDKSTWKNGRFPAFDVHKTDNEKYGVKGSPALVVNGTTVNSGRDSAALLKTICGAFNEVPGECDARLSPDSPSPGFGDGTASGGADANCGG